MDIFVNAEIRPEVAPLALVVQSLNVLSMDACALKECIQNTLLDNPLLEAPTGCASSDDPFLFYSQIKQPFSLYDDLHQQLGCLRISSKIAKAAGLLIDCLDEDGYLREGLSDLAVVWDIPVSILEEALSVVQTLEPLGVGCRNLSECLRIQLINQEPKNELAIDIVTNHLESIANKTFSMSGIDPDDLEEAIDVIRALSPRPCANYSKNQTNYITPDIRVYIDDEGNLLAELINQPIMPVISLLYRNYLDLGTSDDRPYIRKHVDFARTFLHSIQMRTQTLGMIAQYMIINQREYFLQGPEEHRSIPLSLVAETLGLNVSTISRAVANKYVEFRGSVFPLRDMFQGNGNGHLTRNAIICRIKKLLAEQPGLSDSKISALLKEQDIHISRRTVNKYRNLNRNR